jgi:CBS domain-containing protein
MLVKEIMTRNVITVNPDMLLKDLVKILKENRINGVPVVDADNILVGVITMTDLLKILKDINYWDTIEKVKPGLGLKDAFVEEKENATVGKKMTKQVSTVSEKDSVEHVLDLMCKHNIHTIPVVKDGKLIGVVGATDIATISFL